MSTTKGYVDIATGTHRLARSASTILILGAVQRAEDKAKGSLTALALARLDCEVKPWPLLGLRGWGLGVVVHRDVGVVY